MDEDLEEIADQSDIDSSTDVPVWKRYTLTLSEAAAYYHIGEKKLRRIADLYMNEDFILFNGNRVLFKKDKFEQFLDGSNSI